MNKSLCQKNGCPNKGKYARTCGHLYDEEKESKVDMKEYLQVRKKFLKKHPVCQYEGCKKEAKEVHHRRGRKGELLTNEKHFMAVCSAHHAWIETHPLAAKEKGYSESRLKNK